MKSPLSSQSPFRLLTVGFFAGVLCTFLMTCSLTDTGHDGATGAHWGSLKRRQEDDSGILKFGNPGKNYSGKIDFSDFCIYILRMYTHKQ